MRCLPAMTGAAAFLIIGDRSVTTTSALVPEPLLAQFQEWLARQPLAAHTRRVYGTRVRQYCAYLATIPGDYGDPLQEPAARNYAVRDYKAYLKTVRHAKPTSVNVTLAALDHFYGFLGLGRPHVRREALPHAAPRALPPEDQKRFLRAVERMASIRDQAIAHLLFYTEARLSECAALNRDDVLLSARKGCVIIRTGKGNTYREVALNAEVRGRLAIWLQARRARWGGATEPALFLNPQGRRLSTRAIDHLLRRLGRQAGLALSAHILRHTCLTNLIRRGYDLVLVAEIAGHRRPETTRRYGLPTWHDREAAMESLRVDY
jgi:site-specific recombinase XerD